MTPPPRANCSHAPYFRASGWCRRRLRQQAKCPHKKKRNLCPQALAKKAQLSPPGHHQKSATWAAKPHQKMYGLGPTKKHQHAERQQDRDPNGRTMHHFITNPVPLEQAWVWVRVRACCCVTLAQSGSSPSSYITLHPAQPAPQATLRTPPQEP